MINSGTRADALRSERVGGFRFWNNGSQEETGVLLGGEEGTNHSDVALCSNFSPLLLIDPTIYSQHSNFTVNWSN
jgi:hypothetical protein